MVTPRARNTLVGIRKLAQQLPPGLSGRLSMSEELHKELAAAQAAAPDVGDLRDQSGRLVRLAGFHVQIVAVATMLQLDVLPEEGDS